MMDEFNSEFKIDYQGYLAISCILIGLVSYMLNISILIKIFIKTHTTFYSPKSKKFTPIFLDGGKRKDIQRFTAV